MELYVFPLIGEFHADFTGYPGGEGPGAGRNIHANESGGSGGGHGGRGGRAKSGYYSAFAYDSFYTPAEMGSGGGNPPQGGGGRGGGRCRAVVIWDSKYWALVFMYVVYKTFFFEIKLTKLIFYN